MDKERSTKHNKKRSKKSSKKSKKHKRSTSYDDYSSTEERKSRRSHAIKPIVEYSDVSSEDLSGPEAGEITDESGSPSLLYGDKTMRRNSAVAGGVVDTPNNTNNSISNSVNKTKVQVLAEKRQLVGVVVGVHKEIHQSLINASPISSTHSPNQISLSSDSMSVKQQNQEETRGDNEIASPSPIPPEQAER
jgi:hypothetical protein